MEPLWIHTRDRLPDPGKQVLVSRGMNVWPAEYKWTTTGGVWILIGEIGQTPVAEADQWRLPEEL